MYRNVNIAHLSTLMQVTAQIKKHPVLGTSIRKLDLSGFCTSTAPPKTGFHPLLDILTLTPLLREFRINKHTSSYLDHETLQKLFCGLPYLEVLGLSGCNSSKFIEACLTAVCRDKRVTKTLSFLSLAGCSNLPPEFFDSLLRQLPRLQYLDVSNTQITNPALSSIPAIAKLSHLDISYCYALDGGGVVDFLIQHPSMKSLVSLSIETSAGTDHRVLDEEEISRVLSNLPSSLKILNLKNSAISSAHLSLLKNLPTQLEKMCLGGLLRLSDIEKIIIDPGSVEDEELESNGPDEDTEVESKYQIVLSPMEEAIAVCKLRQLINSAPVISYSTSKQLNLKYLDISSLPVVEQGRIRTSILLGPQSRSLEIIELSEKVPSEFGILPKLCAAVGWELKSVGRRCWIRRKMVG